MGVVNIGERAAVEGAEAVVESGALTRAWKWGASWFRPAAKATATEAEVVIAGTGDDVAAQLAKVEGASVGAGKETVRALEETATKPGWADRAKAFFSSPTPPAAATGGGITKEEFKAQLEELRKEITDPQKFSLVSAALNTAWGAGKFVGVAGGTLMGGTALLAALPNDFYKKYIEPHLPEGVKGLVAARNPDKKSETPEEKAQKAEEATKAAADAKAAEEGGWLWNKLCAIPILGNVIKLIGNAADGFGNAVADLSPLAVAAGAAMVAGVGGKHGKHDKKHKGESHEAPATAPAAETAPAAAKPTEVPSASIPAEVKAEAVQVAANGVSAAPTNSASNAPATPAIETKPEQQTART